MSETMVETCVLTLGELIDKDLCNEKFKKFSDEMQTLLKGSEGSKYQLTIPFYQRAYVWSEDMVKIILENIDEQRKEGKKYLLGSLIIYIDDSKEKNDDKNTISEPDSQSKDKKIEFNIVDGQQRLTTLDLVFQFFGEKLDLIKKQKTSSENDIEEKTKQTIEKWFANFANEYKDKDFLTYLKNNIEFVCVFTDSLDDAFIFFDSANAKGKRLERYDFICA